MEPKELKTAGELEAMIVAELKNARLKVSVSPDPASGWHATASSWGAMNIGAIRQVQQIAERLFLSHRTVGGHLHRAFPKLGVATRAALRDALQSLPGERLPRK
jgi:hypothetical protein